MNTNDEKARRLRADLVTSGADPVLSFEWIQADLGISKATFHRGPRHELDVVQISSRRMGVPKSAYERWKAARTIRASAA